METVMNKERIKWVDYYKALAIILVVVGHITGEFNKYIYLFHMAAFFFISGFCTKWNYKNRAELVLKRAYSLLAPLVSFFIFGAITLWMLDITNTYVFWWGELPYIGFANMIKKFFLFGSNYVWWMGACWFVQVLFGVVVLWTLNWLMVTYICNGEKKYFSVISIIVSILLYAVGIEFVHAKFTLYNLDLILIAQLYFGLGMLVRLVYDKNVELFANLYTLKGFFFTIVCTLCSAMLLYAFSNANNMTIDWPTRTFNHPVLGIIVSLNGIALLYLMSIIMEFFTSKSVVIERVFSIIGKNTMSIVYLHFLCFKLVYVILIVAGAIPFTYFSEFTPTLDDVGNKYLILFSVIAIAGSIGIWKLLTLNKYIKYLLGESFVVKNKITIWSKAIDDWCSKNLIKENLGLIKIIVNHIRKNRVESFLVIALAIASLFPLAKKGVILNDEVLHRLYRQNSLIELVSYGINNELRMGRILRIMAPINQSIGFLSDNMVINNIIQIGLIMIAIIVLGLFAYEYTQDKRVSLISVVLLLATMPITFEHSYPSAFVGLVTMPLVWLGIALIAWKRYIAKNQKSTFYIAVSCWAISLLGYEYILTYTPLFLFIAMIEGNGDLWKRCKRAIAPLLIGGFYFIVTIGYQKLQSNVYAGAKVGFKSISSSLSIISTLVKSAIPGYFLTNSKYRYLIYVYTGEKNNWLLEKNNIENIINNKAQIIDFLYEYVLTTRNIVIAITLIGFCVIISKQSSIKHELSMRRDSVVIICSVIYIILPTLPNAVAEMYQGQVTENFFTSLPVSINISFTISFLIAFLLARVYESKFKKFFMLLFAIVIIDISLGIQTMNGVISGKHAKNFDRISTIEKMLSTKSVANLNNSVIKSSDIVETRDLLAINCEDWMHYTSNLGLNILFSESVGDYYLSFINDSYFSIVGSKQMAIISPMKLDVGIIKYDNGEKIAVETDNYIIDNGMYCYIYDDRLENIVTSDVAFIEEAKSAGSTIDTITKVEGFYDDGWIEPSAEFEIYCGESGAIHIKGYYPENLNNDTFTVYINDINVGTYDLLTNDFEIDIPVELSSQVVNVKLDTTLRISDKGNDLRNLSYMVKDINWN